MEPLTQIYYTGLVGHVKTRIPPTNFSPPTVDRVPSVGPFDHWNRFLEGGEERIQGGGEGRRDDIRF